MHELPAEKLKIRDVVQVDIANDPIAPADYRETEDPAKWVFIYNQAGSHHWRGRLNLDDDVCFPDASDFQ